MKKKERIRDLCRQVVSMSESTLAAAGIISKMNEAIRSLVPLIPPERLAEAREILLRSEPDFQKLAERISHAR